MPKNETVLNVAAAQSAIDGLEAKIGDRRRRKAELDTEQTAIAFEAHTVGGAAGERLAAIIREVAEITVEMDGLAVALKEGRAWLAAAREAEARAGDRTKAERAKAIAQRVRGHAAAMDAAIDTYRKAAAALEADTGELHAMGGLMPGQNLIAVNMRTAVETVFAGLVRGMSPVAPKNRKTFAGLFQGWMATVDRNADALAAGPKKEAA